MSAILMILVVIVASLAGMEGVLDEFQFHQPLIACTLIGLVTGHLVPCVIAGTSAGAQRSSKDHGTMNVCKMVGMLMQ